jgi:vitamin B12 transporter
LLPIGLGRAAIHATGVVLLSISALLTHAAAPSRDDAAWKAPRAELLTFDIPAMPLAEALQRFAQQVQQPLSFDRAALGDALSNAVSGRMTADEALQRMLQSTGIGYRRSAKGVWLVGPMQGSSRGVWGLASRSGRAGRDIPANAGAQMADGETAIDSIVVSASRTPLDIDRTASDVSVISIEDAAVQQIDDLKTALGQQPGVTVVTTGAVGGETYVFVRGAYPHHTLLIVDGVRMNDRAANYNAFMSYADLGGINRIEVLRGPQSPMYGSAAIGGVVLMNTMRGSDELHGNVKLSSGSFDTYAVSGALSGEQDAFDYSFAASGYRTANDWPGNEFDSSSYAAHLGTTAAAGLRFGATFRGQQGEYAALGSRMRPEKGVATTSNQLATLYASWESAEMIDSRVVVGLHRREYLWRGDSPSAQLNERLIVDWQTAWRHGEVVEVVAGVNQERSDYEVNGFQTREEITAAFISGVVAVTDEVTLNAGIRYDDFASVGDALTWRTGVAWNALAYTKLRATFGTGFAAPGSADRYGVPAWGQLPNPGLLPEVSRGWDVGIDHALAGERLSLTVTYFENRFERLIDWVELDPITREGMFVNRGRALTQGYELGAAVRMAPAWQARLGYTYLESSETSSGERLSWRPRHSLDLSSWFELSPNWLIGFGVRGVWDRVHEVGPIRDYTVVRLFSSWKVSDQLSIRARVENLFDATYEEVYGYRSLPRGVHGSVEWKF